MKKRVNERLGETWKLPQLILEGKPPQSVSFSADGHRTDVKEASPTTHVVFGPPSIPLNKETAPTWKCEIYYLFPKWTHPQ
jgi:hypothetical protein